MSYLNKVSETAFFNGKIENLKYINFYILIVIAPMQIPPSDLNFNQKVKFVTRHIDNKVNIDSITKKLEKKTSFYTAVNHYHKESHLGCCSSPRSVSGRAILILLSIFSST